MWEKILVPRSERSDLGRAVTLGMSFAIGMAVFSFLGYYIDQKRGPGSMLFTIFGIILGLSYGAYEVWIVIRMLNEEAKKAMEHRSPPPPDKPKRE